MAVVEPTLNLARSLLAQFIRIPALVQTTSFLRKAKPIHLLLGASRQSSYSEMQLLVVQFSKILFTQKWVSLSLVAVLQCTSPQASGKGIEFSAALNFSLYIHIFLLQTLFFHYNASGDTSPKYLASEKKPLSANYVLICNSSRQLYYNWTISGAQHIYSSSRFLLTHSTKTHKSTFRSQWIGCPHFDDVSPCYVCFYKCAVPII